MTTEERLQAIDAAIKRTESELDELEYELQDLHTKQSRLEAQLTELDEQRRQVERNGEVHVNPTPKLKELAAISLRGMSWSEAAKINDEYEREWKRLHDQADDALRESAMA